MWEGEEKVFMKCSVVVQGSEMDAKKDFREEQSIKETE